MNPFSMIIYGIVIFAGGFILGPLTSFIPSLVGGLISGLGLWLVCTGLESLSNY